MKSIVVACVVALLLIEIASGRWISAIAVAPHRGEVYTAENGGSLPPVLHTIDSTSLSVIDAHYLPGVVSDLIVRTVDRNEESADRKRLLAIIAGNTSSDIASFKLPISRQATLPTILRGPLSEYVDNWILNVNWGLKDDILVVATYQNVVIVDLGTLEVLDTVALWGGRSVFAVNAVYNANNKHLVIFRADRPSKGDNIIVVQEFDLSNKTFTPINTTYNCFCETGLKNSPFYNTFFHDCQMDYTNNKIWCADGTKGKLTAFKTNNLSQFEIFNTDNVEFESVEWDFPNGRAYVFAFKSTKFTVYKINLFNGNVLGSYTADADWLGAYKKHSQDPNLYIAIPGSIKNNNKAPKLIVLNTNSMTAEKVKLGREVGDT